MATASAKQRMIDSIAYPPTHTYSIKDMKPTNVLAQRMGIIKKSAPDFFTKAKSFLDVGCNKGFFSLYGSDMFDDVLGIDSKDLAELWTSIKRDNTEFVNTTFRMFNTRKMFDRVFIGNTHYKMYTECGGWEWISKLAAITCGGGLVLIEGPVSMECMDMQQAIPEKLRSGFMFKEFTKEMSRFFTMKVMVPTVGYTPDRYIMLFERKPNPIENRFELKDIAAKMMRHNTSSNSDICSTNMGMIAKIYRRGAESEGDFKSKMEFMRSRVNISSMSPVSNGLEGSVYDGNVFVGWLEKTLAVGPLQYNDRSIKAFRQHCIHQIFLLRIGYIDTDCGTINFAPEKGELLCFDKNSTYPIDVLEEYIYKLDGGTYFKILSRVHNFSDELKRTISDAMATKDPSTIERAYVKVLKILKNGT